MRTVIELVYINNNDLLALSLHFFIIFIDIEKKTYELCVIDRRCLNSYIRSSIILYKKIIHNPVARLSKTDFNKHPYAYDFELSANSIIRSLRLFSEKTHGIYKYLIRPNE